MCISASIHSFGADYSNMMIRRLFAGHASEYPEIFSFQIKDTIFHHWKCYATQDKSASLIICVYPTIKFCRCFQERELYNVSSEIWPALHIYICVCVCVCVYIHLYNQSPLFISYCWNFDAIPEVKLWRLALLSWQKEDLKTIYIYIYTHTYTYIPNHNVTFGFRPRQTVCSLCTFPSDSPHIMRLSFFKFIFFIPKGVTFFDVCPIVIC